jgi:hypothetical protein
MFFVLLKAPTLTMRPCVLGPFVLGRTLGTGATGMYTRVIVQGVCFVCRICGPLVFAKQFFFPFSLLSLVYGATDWVKHVTVVL